MIGKTSKAVAEVTPAAEKTGTLYYYSSGTSRTFNDGFRAINGRALSPDGRTRSFRFASRSAHDMVMSL